MKKLAVRLGFIALMVYIGLCALMYLNQDRLLYFPSPERDRPGFHALFLKSGAVVVKVWELDEFPAYWLAVRGLLALE